MSLVADYGSSSAESEESDTPEMSDDQVSSPLLNPFRGGGAGRIPSRSNSDEQSHEEVNLSTYNHDPTAVNASVFANPFKAAEDAQQAMLEKHVKLTPAKNSIQSINGKQICWNYRKGRCRFGHRCKFAHDSDLNLPVEPPVLEVPVPIASAEPSSSMAIPDKPSGKRKRPGLSQSITPGKKVMKIYNKQMSKEKPWLVSATSV